MQVDGFWVGDGFPTLPVLDGWRWPRGVLREGPGTEALEIECAVRDFGPRVWLRFVGFAPPGAIVPARTLDYHLQWIGEIDGATWIVVQEWPFDPDDETATQHLLRVEGGRRLRPLARAELIAIHARANSVVGADPALDEPRAEIALGITFT